MANIEAKGFKNINLNDDFFSSLKDDYKEFESWFNKKGLASKKAFVLYEDTELMAFLYLKIEEDEITDVSPVLEAKRRLKVGTFKIDAHGTKLGERFVKKIFDIAEHKNIDEIYVTIFDKHGALINLLKTFGFFKYGTKTTSNGIETVLLKQFSRIKNDILKDYPIVQTEQRNKFVLSIYPKWHTKLFSDSILNNESVDILEDTSYTNSIHKIYICAMSGVQEFQKGDPVLIYRTKDREPAKYRSVVTSICVIEEVENIYNFSNVDDFIVYCEPYSIFSESELRSFYTSKKYPFIIKMTYNVAFKKRVTNGYLKDNIGINPNYWGVFKVTDDDFFQIINAGEIDESLIIN